MTHPLEKSNRKMKAARHLYRKHPEMELPARMLQAATADLITESLCTCGGFSEARARATAKAVCGGRAGRLFVELAFSEADDEKARDHVR